MLKENLPKLSYQNFYVSKQESNSILIPETVRIGKSLKKLGITKDAVISLKYGKRVLINAKNTKLGELKREDFLEIVDYDPIKNILLIIGPKESKINSSNHWMIHHARDDVNAVIEIIDNALAEKLEKNLPSTKKEWPPGSLELTKEILGVARDSKKIVIKNQGIMFVGSSTNEAEDLLLKTYEDVE